MFDIHVDTSAPRGRTLDGGTIWSLGIKVPRGDSSGEGRAAHGPLHPAVNRSLETLMALLFVFLLWSWFCHLVAYITFFVSGVGILYGILALQDSTPFWNHVCCPLSLSLFVFSLFGGFCRRRVFSSLLFLSGAGETQTFLVWVSPCVLFFMAAIAHSDPYSELRTYTQVSARSCVFFSFVVVDRWYCGSRSRFAWSLSGFWPLAFGSVFGWFLVWSVVA